MNLNQGQLPIIPKLEKLIGIVLAWGEWLMGPAVRSSGRHFHVSCSRNRNQRVLTA